MKKKVELLAPAGNLAAFYGAIHAGADAVYLAGTKYGARAYADNFTQEDLVKCLRYAHLLRKKVYLTINTLVKEEELKELIEVIRQSITEKCKSEKKPYSLTIGVGYDQLSGAQDTFQKCMERADEKLYKDKERVKASLQKNEQTSN